MNIHSAARICLLVSLLVPVLHVLAVERDTAAGKQATPTTSAVESTTRETLPAQGNQTRPVYVPPRRGAPLTRVGGGTRGSDDPLPVVAVITPAHTGLAANPQPALYWYLSKATRTRFEFALVNDFEIEPIMEITSDGDMPAGFNRIDLAVHGVTLEPGIAYQWSVALVQDPVQRSADIVSSGRIEYVTPPAVLQARLENATPVEAVHILAGAGYWYDTFAGLSIRIAAEPGNTILLEARADLLEQVGLADLTGRGVAGSGSGKVE